MKDYEIVPFNIRNRKSNSIKFKISKRFLVNYFNTPEWFKEYIIEHEKDVTMDFHYSFQPFQNQCFDQAYVKEFILAYTSIYEGYEIADHQSKEILALISCFWKDYKPILHEQFLKNRARILLNIIKKKRFYNETDLKFEELQNIIDDDDLIWECIYKITKKHGYGDPPSYHNEETGYNFEIKNLAEILWWEVANKIKIKGDIHLYYDPRVDLHLKYDGKYHELTDETLVRRTYKTLLLSIINDHRKEKTEFYKALTELDWKNPDFTNLNTYCGTHTGVKWKEATVILCRKLYSYLNSNTELKYVNNNFKKNKGISKLQKKFVFEILFLLGLKHTKAETYHAHKSWDNYKKELNDLTYSRNKQIDVEQHMTDFVENPIEAVNLSK